MEGANTCTLNMAVTGHLPSSRVRLSDRELRSEGLTSSDNRREKTVLRDACNIPLFIESDRLFIQALIGKQSEVCIEFSLQLFMTSTC